MSATRVSLAVVLLACTAVSVWAVGAPVVFKSSRWQLSASGPAVTIVSADPAGRGEFRENLGLTIAPAAVPAAAAAQAHPTVTASGITISGVRALSVRYQTRYDKLQRPISLEGHKSLGVLVHSPRSGLCYAAIMTPTWTKKDSAVTIQVRRGGPSGPVLASHRFANVVDNSFTGFYFDPLPKGDYFIELVQPKGPVGAWAADGDPLDFADAYLDGQRLANTDLCIALKWGTAVQGTVVVSQTPDGALRYRFSCAAGQAVPQIALSHRWVMSGYEISPATTPVRAYVTDDGQYLPAQQLKRRAEAKLALHPARALRLLGTGKLDIQIEPVRGACNIDLSYNRLAVVFPATDLKISATYDGERWLEIFPRFYMPDRKLTRDWNTFLLERAFSYHPLHWSPVADWMEWRARLLYWMNLPGLFRRDLPYLLSYKMTDDGYVYTWGNRPEWPFPDNEKYDARHFTTNANYILACWRAFCWSGDTQFLRRVMPRVRKAMNWQLTECRGADGLFIDNSPDHDGTTRGVPSNYWDDIPFGYKSAYENVYFYASLLAMAELERAYASLPGRAAKPADPRAIARPPRYYLRLARGVHDNFDKTFWAGDHYIACVDITGKRHDYGITYVNLEAFAYGLGNPQKAQKFYRWLETVVTSSGKRDMYYFVFAPRVNAWDLSKTWWYLEGKGKIKPQPWGTHCENGGAILYTSHYDLLDRARYLSPANALRRMRAIIGRWRLPDHLSGGNPLYTNQITGWAVGTDIPFPESGLTPICPVYCFLGLDARADGLHIRPNLDASIPWIKATGVRWRGLAMDLSAGIQGDGYRVRVSVRAPKANAGERLFTIKRGEEVVLTRPPRGNFPPPPLAGMSSAAHWIWTPGLANVADSRCFARKVFVVPRTPTRAVLAVAVDNDARVFLDGALVGHASGWLRPPAWDVTAKLSPGRHVLAIAAVNSDGPAGVAAQLAMRFADHTATVITDATWRVSATAAEGWQGLDFDDSRWQSAEDLGVIGIEPWGWVRFPEAGGH